MTFDVSSWLSLKPAEAVVLNFFLPFIVAFLVGLLIYAWINKVALQSTGFSPTMASILTTPIVGCVYHGLMTIGHGFQNTLNNLFLAMILSFVFFAPVYLILTPLLVLYLRRAFLRKTTHSRILISAMTAACLVLQTVWLYFWLNHPS